MDITQLAAELRGGKFRSFYLIKGNEAYLMRSVRDQIIHALFPEGRPEIDIFHAEESGLAGVLDALRTPSMFLPHRLVLVEGAGELKKVDFDAIAVVAEKGISGGALILIGEGILLASHKNFPKSGAIVECKKLYNNQIPGWLSMEAKRFGVTLSREAGQSLVDAVGENLGELAQALEKLSLYVGDKKLIDQKDVEELIGVTGQKNIFALCNAIGEKKGGRALGLIEGMLGQGEPPLMVLTMVVRHFRLLAKAQDLLKRKASPSELASGLGVSPYFAKDYAAQARHFSSSGWKRRFHDLSRTDGALKGSRHKKSEILKKLAWDLMQD